MNCDECLNTGKIDGKLCPFCRAHCLDENDYEDEDSPDQD